MHQEVGFSLSITEHTELVESDGEELILPVIVPPVPVLQCSQKRSQMK